MEALVGEPVTERNEHEWQAAVRTAGLSGQYWALVRLLIDKGVITVDELKQAIEAEAGRSVYSHMSCGVRVNPKTGALEWFQE